MALPYGRRDAQRRVAASEIGRGCIDIRVGRGSVELGHTARDEVRVRSTVPTLGRLRIFGGPGYRLSSYGLRIHARRARLQVDLPADLIVRVRVRRGQITSWGAGGDLTLVSGDRVACRELRATIATARGREVSLHFAAAPQRVAVEAGRAVIALPGGPYAVTAPAGAEVTVPREAGALREIIVRALDARVLAAARPLDLTGEQAAGG